MKNNKGRRKYNNGIQMQVNAKIGEQKSMK